MTRGELSKRQWVILVCVVMWLRVSVEQTLMIVASSTIITFQPSCQFLSTIWHSNSCNSFNSLNNPLSQSVHQRLPFPLVLLSPNATPIDRQVTCSACFNNYFTFQQPFFLRSNPNTRQRIPYFAHYKPYRNQFSRFCGYVLTCPELPCNRPVLRHISGQFGLKRKWDVML